MLYNVSYIAIIVILSMSYIFKKLMVG